MTANDAADGKEPAFRHAGGAKGGSASADLPGRGTAIRP